MPVGSDAADWGGDDRRGIISAHRRNHLRMDLDGSHHSSRGRGVFGVETGQVEIMSVEAVAHRDRRARIVGRGETRD